MIFKPWLEFSLYTKNQSAGEYLIALDELNKTRKEEFKAGFSHGRSHNRHTLVSLCRKWES